MEKIQHHRPVDGLPAATAPLPPSHPLRRSRAHFTASFLPAALVAPPPPPPSTATSDASPPPPRSAPLPSDTSTLSRTQSPQPSTPLAASARTPTTTLFHLLVLAKAVQAEIRDPALRQLAQDLLSAEMRAHLAGQSQR